MNAATAPEIAPRQAPLTLWRVAQAFIGTLHMLFGAPEATAAKHTLVRDAYMRLSSWLACGEAFMRRLIAIEAATYVVQAAEEEPKPPRKSALRQRRLIGFDADTPEQWRVSFRCLPGRRGPPRIIPQHVETKARAERPDPRFRSAWPLAERYEALIRAYNNPASYARRLARRLYVSPHSVRAVLQAPAEASDRIDGFEDATALCKRSWPSPHRESG
jgi:hypothetical protein